MTPEVRIRVLIVGADEIATELFHKALAEPDIILTGIVDEKNEFSDLTLALSQNIPVFNTITEAMQSVSDFVIQLSGDDAVTAQIKALKSSHTKIITKKRARLFLNLIRQTREQAGRPSSPPKVENGGVQVDAVQPPTFTPEPALQVKSEEPDVNTGMASRLADSQELYHLGIAITAAETLNDSLTVILREALRILKKPAGSIALYEAKTNTFTLKAFEGFTRNLSHETSWKVRKGGLTELILNQKTPTIINNAKDCPHVDEIQTFLDAGIQSLVAVPFFAEARTVGILYIDDFTPQEWSPREIDFLILLGAQAAFALEKFKMIKDIKETKTYLQNIFDNSADVMVTCDKDMRVAEFNKAAERILGYSREEVIGTIAEFAWLRPDERKSVIKKMEKQGFIANYETQFKAKNGNIIDVNLTLSYIRNCNGEIIGTVGICRDITEQKRLERAIEAHNQQLQALNESLEEKVLTRTTELRQANHELARMNKVKSEFIATISHELRTPLNSILGFSELLRDDETTPLTERQKHYAANIHNSGAHLLKLINNILDLAKIESGKTNLQYESIPLREIVSEVDAVIRPLAEQRTQQFNIHFADTISIIQADRMKFIQILYNLLSNAMKFTPEGGRISLQAELHGNIVPAELGQTLSKDLEPADEYLELRVSDTGIGIRVEDQDRIFSEFEQVDGSYARQYEGTGLGLALTRKLVELHGGRIAVESAEGKGSTFTVIIPLRPEGVPAVTTLTSTFAETISKDEELFVNKEKQGALVLLVEDDAATAELMTTYLTQSGYRVAHAFNGEEVINRTRELNPFAVILDIMLPGKDGWQILQELKSDPDMKDIPVIVVSIIDNRDLGFALGAADYLIKPVDKGTLCGKLKELNFIPSKVRRPLNILCIDSDEDAQSQLRNILEPEGYHVFTAGTGKEGIENALTYRPDLIILDLLMPDLDGVELPRIFKNNIATMDIPILVLTEKEISMEDRLKLAGKIESTMQKNYFSQEDLLTHIRDLEITYPVRAGLLDQVSGLFDGSYFQIRLAQEIYRAERYHTTFAIMMADIDGFSEYANLAGAHNCNICIRKIADFLRKTSRGSECLVRYGVDEFAILLSGATEEAARVVAQRMLSFIESYHFPGTEQLNAGKFSVSIAIIHYNRMGICTAEQMIFEARKLIREIKKAGGGNIKIYGPTASGKDDPNRGK